MEIKMEQFFLSLNEVIFGSYNSDLVFTVVGIHATVLSILIGFSTAYVLHINSQINEVKNNAFSIAEQVNKIKFSNIWLRLVGPGILFLKSWKSTDQQIAMWLSSPSSLSEWGEDRVETIIPPFKIYIEKFNLNSTEFNLCLLAASALRYPFPERMVISKNGVTGLQPNPVLIFNDIKTLKKWSDDVKEYFFLIMNYNTWFGIEEFTRRFDWESDINLNKISERNGEKYGPEIIEKFKKIPNEFLSNVEKIYNIAQNVRVKLTRYDFFKKLMPSKTVIYIALIWSISAFISSIIAPLFFPSISKFYLILVPCSFYLFLLVYSSIRVLSIIK